MAGTSGSPSCASELEDQLDRIELKARYARRYSDHRATPLLGALLTSWAAASGAWLGPDPRNA